MSGIMALRKGDALQVRAEFTDRTTGAEYSMAGWTLGGTLQFANCPVVELSCSWLDESTGVALVELDASETADLEVGDHVLQVRATSPGGKPTSSTPVTVRVRD